MAPAPVVNAYIGTYTRSGESRGIYCCHFDPAVGTLAVLDACENIADPSWLSLSPDGATLYAASEKTDVSEVHAYRILPDGSLKPLGHMQLPASSLCHLAISADGRMLAGAGYRSGNLISLPLMADGSLGPLAENIRHQGLSVHPTRQEGPHVHSSAFSPDGKFLLVCDLGTDTVTTYAVDASQAKLHAASVLHTPAGEGPRHTAFSPDGRLLYVATELKSNVLTCAYDGAQGSLRFLRSASALPPDFSGTSTAADIHLSPDGRFLYVSNRGADDIACFALDGEGLPVYQASCPTLGKTPRHFVLTGDGQYLLAANQDSGTVVVFLRDLQTGRLLPASSAKIPRPSCVCIK